MGFICLLTVKAFSVLTLFLCLLVSELTMLFFLLSKVELVYYSTSIFSIIYHCIGVSTVRYKINVKYLILILTIKHSPEINELRLHDSN